MDRSRGMPAGGSGPIESEPERARRILGSGVVAYRGASLVWMVVANVLAKEPLRHAAVGWAAIALTGVWTTWLVVEGNRSRPVLAADLALSCGLILLSGFEVPARGTRIFFATTYPASSALAWGAAEGWPAGLAAGGVLSVALALSRPIGGVGFGEFTSDDVVALLNGIVYYLLAGGAAGVVTRTIDRSAGQVEAATQVALRAREREGRLAERQSLAVRIHDEVLHALADVEREARELGRLEAVPGSRVARLANLVEDQEMELRTLIFREPEDAPQGSCSLRDALEAKRKGRSGVRVVVSTPGPIWLPIQLVEELAEAVGQALDNIERYANASSAAVFADVEDGWLEVAVRDDGRGFVFSEELLRASDRGGMLKSMKARVEALGGRMRVHSAVGVGTEVEFRIPVTVAGPP